MFSTLPNINFNFSLIFIFSSTNAFNLDKSITLSFGKELTLFHTILTFNHHDNKPFKKTTFFLFSSMFSTLPKTNFNFSLTCNLSSANALNLDKYKTLSFGKEFTLSQTSPGFNVSAVQVF